MTNYEKTDVIFGVLECAFSDHLAIFCVSPCSVSKRTDPSAISALHRNVSDKNIKKFVNLVLEADWGDVVTKTDPNKY